ncbi:MAG: hypothetical protein LBK77_04725 [Spirochaetaceae bacterium]|jgi:hypothetical protein|nr:hypothetical protein [Spirochaetaceae bacterium]
MGTGRLRVWQLVLCCAAAAAGNVLLYSFVSRFLRLSLFLDTLFTVTVTFIAGIVPGIITALATSAATNLLFSIPPLYSLFALCSITEVFIAASFRRGIPGSRIGVRGGGQDMDALISIVAGLFLVAVIDCFVISILGGGVDFFISSVSTEPRQFFSPDDFKLGLLLNGLPVLLADILCRIPINIVDRFIVMFGAFGAALLFRRAREAKKPAPKAQEGFPWN